MSVTKSLRVSNEKDEHIQFLKDYLNEPTESAVLSRIFESGLQNELTDLAIQIYLESDRNISLSHIAEDFNLSPIYLYKTCIDRGINLLDIDKDDLKDDLEKASEYFEESELEKIFSDI